LCDRLAQNCPSLPSRIETRDPMVLALNLRLLLVQNLSHARLLAQQSRNFNLQDSCNRSVHPVLPCRVHAISPTHSQERA
jgi:hypothetical protein